MASCQRALQMFSFRVLMEKYRKGQQEFHWVFMDLKKGYVRDPRKKLILHEEVRGGREACEGVAEHV